MKLFKPAVVVATVILILTMLPGKEGWKLCVFLLLGSGGFLVGLKHYRIILAREREFERLKEDFISNAGHELRTPLTSIKGFSQLLLNEEGLSPTQMEYLRYIFEQSMEMERIVHDLLDISDAAAGGSVCLEKEVCDIVPIIHDTVCRIRESHPGHHFEESLTEASILIAVDPKKFTRAMENLLDNAMKFSPGGGRIVVSCESSEVQVRIAVQDEGIGMTAGQLEKIFDPFYRADASNTAAEGWGIGMSLARGVVEAHGGRIWVESEPEKGTTVSFTMPGNLADSVSVGSMADGGPYLEGEGKSGSRFVGQGEQGLFRRR